MRRLFIDMDGTLNQFEKGASLEEITSPGFFATRKPHFNLIEAINHLKKVELYILSSVFMDNHSIAEKNQWLNENQLQHIDIMHRIYVPYGVNKSEYLRVHYSLQPDDLLLDDFTQNLHQWHGVGIKLYNGINGTKGTWRGYSVHINATSKVLENSLRGIIHFA